jgi:hypothetical protein
MQLSRVLAAAIPFVADEDYLLTTDADMLPLNRAYFYQQDPRYRFHIFSADAYTDIASGRPAPKYPMCYLGAKALDWKSVMGITTKDIDAEAKLALEGRPDTWNNDEDYFISRLHRHSSFHVGALEKFKDHYSVGSCELFMRGWDGSGVALKRVDRATASYHKGLIGRKDAIDAHFFRPGYTERDSLLSIIEAFSTISLEWVAGYVDTFKDLVENGKAH